MNKSERWCEIKGFSNYLVSDHGRILNRKKQRYMTQILTADGTIASGISSDDGQQHVFRVAKLVWCTFVGEDLGGLTIGFVDGNKLNVAIWNLKLVPFKRGRQRVKNTDTGEVFESFSAAARSVGVPSGSIRYAARHKTRRIMGQRFEVLEEERKT